MGHAHEQPAQHHQLHDCRGLSSRFSFGVFSRPPPPLFRDLEGFKLDFSCAEAMAMWTEDPNPMFGNDLPHFGPGLGPGSIRVHPVCISGDSCGCSRRLGSLPRSAPDDPSPVLQSKDPVTLEAQRPDRSFLPRKLLMGTCMLAVPFMLQPGRISTIRRGAVSRLWPMPIPRIPKPVILNMRHKALAKPSKPHVSKLRKGVGKLKKVP